MRIFSKFKDYYDHIGFQFGQDPQCVYERKPLKDLYERLKGFDASKYRWFFPHAHHCLTGTARTFGEVNSRRYRDMCYVVVGLKVYPLIVTVNSWFDEETKTDCAYKTYKHLDRDTDADLFYEQILESNRPAFPVIPDEEAVKAVIRAVGAPVFKVYSVDGQYLRVDERVPILKDLGFPAVLPPEQAWQQIYSVLTNVLRRDPDKEPPLTIGNEARIETAGFDLKTSFRHPIRFKKE